MEHNTPRLLIITALLASAGCGSESATSSSVATTPTSTGTSTTTAGASAVPAMYTQFYGTQVSLDGTFVVIRATSVPDHPSPYFGQGSANYNSHHVHIG